MDGAAFSSPSPLPCTCGRPAARTRARPPTPTGRPIRRRPSVASAIIHPSVGCLRAIDTSEAAAGGRTTRSGGSTAGSPGVLAHSPPPVGAASDGTIGA
jgi:hypothetical protein